MAENDGVPAPPPLPADDVLALQFTNLLANFTANVDSLLKIPSNQRSTGTAVSAAIARVTKAPAFMTTSMMFANGTPFAALLQALNTLSVNSTRKQLTALDTTNRTTAENTNETPAPYLQAIRKPAPLPRRLPVLTEQHDPTEEMPSPQLNPRAMARINRTASRVLGFKPHEMVRVTAAAPLDGPLHFRATLNEGRYPGPCVVLPTNNPRILYVLSEPRHLPLVRRAYDAVKRVAQNIPLPDIEVSTPKPPAEFIEDSPQALNAAIKIAENEAIRLSEPTNKWAPRRHFIKSLRHMVHSLLPKLQAANPQDPLLIEMQNATRAEEEENDRPRKRFASALVQTDLPTTAEGTRMAIERNLNPQTGPVDSVENQ